MIGDNTYTVIQKNVERERIAREVEAYLSGGGVITSCAIGAVANPAEYERVEMGRTLLRRVGSARMFAGPSVKEV